LHKTTYHPELSLVHIVTFYRYASSYQQTVCYDQAHSTTNGYELARPFAVTDELTGACFIDQQARQPDIGKGHGSEVRITGKRNLLYGPQRTSHQAESVFARQ